jgi:hypothetical protein
VLALHRLRGARRSRRVQHRRHCPGRRHDDLIDLDVRITKYLVGYLYIGPRPRYVVEHSESISDSTQITTNLRHQIFFYQGLELRLRHELELSLSWLDHN